MTGQVEGRNVNVTLQAMGAVAKADQLEQIAEQQESESDIKNAMSEAINPFATRIKHEKIEKHKSRIQKMKQAGGSSRLLPIEQIKDSANQFQRRNPELNADRLVALRERIKPGDTKEDILKLINEFDVYLAEDVLDFLLATTDGDLAETVKEAKNEFIEQHAHEVAIGRNISAQARQAAEKGLGTATSLKDMYKEITDNPRDSTTLFEELSTKYEFKDLKKVIDFLLHSLGADLRSKGPSIPRGMLHRLLKETRSLQAVLGVYRFYRGRTRLINKMFQKEGLELPPQLTFESIAKQFMILAAERYPASAKVLQTASKLGIEGSVAAKIIVYSQMRDGVREVSVSQIYNNDVQRRDQLYTAVLEALEDLEDQLEDLVDKQEGLNEGVEDVEEDDEIQPPHQEKSEM